MAAAESQRRWETARNLRRNIPKLGSDAGVRGDSALGKPPGHAGTGTVVRKSEH